MKQGLRGLVAVVLVQYAAVTLVHAGPRGSKQSPLSPYDAAIREARNAVAALLNTKGAPGIQVAVAVQGQTAWSEGFGLADVEQQVAVTAATRFRLGSVSKLLTAAALAKLGDEGKVDLDAPVQRYVPGFPAKPWPITIRQLAGHTAGIRHYTAEDFTGPLGTTPHFTTIAKSLTIFQDDPLVFEPTTNYGYSSYGWNLIGAAIEGASGEEFLRYVQRSVIEPLALTHTVPDQLAQIVPSRTRFYDRTPDGGLVHAKHVDNSYKWPGGGYLSTAEDLVAFGSAHLRPGFLKAATLDTVLTSQRLRGGKDTGVGIGWRIGVDSKGRRILHHGGTIEGGRALLMVFPQSKVVVAILANMLVPITEADVEGIGALFIS